MVEAIKMDMNKKELVERYLYAVTHKLPESQRIDIQKELRGLIEDMLDERVQGELATQLEIEEVLTELGNPIDLAEKYRGHKRYLIGPEILDTYLVVLKVVAVSIFIALSVVFAIEFISNPMSVLDHFIDYLVSLIMGSVQGFAWVTLIFSLIEYKGVKAAAYAQIGNKPEWSPAHLPEIPNVKAQIKPIEPIAGIIFSVLFMVLFIFGSNLIGVHVTMGEGGTIIPFLDEEVLRGALPLLFGLFGLGVVRECIKLFMKQWNMKLALYCLLFNIVSFVLAFLVLGDQSIWNPQFMNDLMAADIVSLNSESYNLINSIWAMSTERLIYMVGLVLLLETIMVFFKVRRVGA